MRESIDSAENKIHGMISVAILKNAHLGLFHNDIFATKLFFPCKTSVLVISNLRKIWSNCVALFIFNNLTTMSNVLLL